MKLRLAAVVGWSLVLGVAGLAAAHDDDGDNKGGGGPPGQGSNGPFPSRNMKLLAHVPLNMIGGGGSVIGSDIWGWTDPLTGREYAIFGLSNKTSFIDITDPEHPVYLGNLPTHTGNSVWREMKTYQNHAYIVSDGNGAHGMQVFDLTQLRGVTVPQVFSETAHYSGFGNAHNIFINEDTGFAYAVGSNTFGGGLHLMNLSNPIAPTFAGGFAAHGYTHDLQVVTYHGPDAAYVGREIAFNSNGRISGMDAFAIVDVTNKAAPVSLARLGYPGAGYTHQGWLTEDHHYFIMDDELDETGFGHNTRTLVWDVSDLNNPVYVGFHEHDTRAIDHNLFVKGNLVFESNYTVGLRVLELRDLANAVLREVAFFDTYPADDAVSFNGDWGNYPFFASGNIIIGDRQNGLFIVRIVPEPSTLALAGTGVAALAVPVWRRWRRGR